MELQLGSVNWLAILVCVVVGQVFLTVWFAVVFARPWAKAYGVDEPKQHTNEVPGYTYGIGLLCVVLLSLGLSLLQENLGIATVGGGLSVGFFVAVHFSIATALPGYAFLRRWRACALALGSQATLILILSAILAAFQLG